MTYKKNKIIVASLNWGLGHSARCIPIIYALIDSGFTPILASDGAALTLFQKEFPQLKCYALPSYNIEYSRHGSRLKYKLLFASLSIYKSIKKEKLIIDQIVDKEKVIGIISDNRFGVRSKKAHSVYITHQINVLSGKTTSLTTWFHQKIISKFDCCWIPDTQDKLNLSGTLSKTDNSSLNLKFIGPVSRFAYRKCSKKFDLLILLSGPEPQRTILEAKLMKELEVNRQNVVFVKGLVSGQQKTTQSKNLRIVNFMLQNELEKTINNSKIIVARSGYSTIMDLDRLRTKAFFIPTPGQYEQEYLAKNLEQKNIAPYARQQEFTLKMLEEVENYSGFKTQSLSQKTDFKALFKKEFLD